MKNEFKRIFGVEFYKFSDNLMTLLTGQICIDLIKFDDYLKRTYCTYTDNMSMNDFITNKFDKKASELIESMI